MIAVHKHEINGLKSFRDVNFKEVSMKYEGLITALLAFTILALISEAAVCSR